jgi:nicotinamidase-related amidase
VNSTALIVIDMQNDFCDPSAQLFVAGAPAIVNNVAYLMDRFRGFGMPVVVVLRRHRCSGIDVDVTRLDRFNADPFLIDSPGADLVDGLAISESDIVVVKHRWSAFFATDLDLVLRRSGIRTVVLTGVQTPNCIRATANDATSLDYRCIVVSDGTASATSRIQDANLADMAQMGVEIATTSQVSLLYAQSPALAVG